MKKILFLLLGLFLLTACSSKEQKYDVNTIYYDLNISNYYQENITFTLPSNAYELAVHNKEEQQYDSIEYILLLDNFSRPIQNNLYTLYGKRISQLENAIEVDLQFDYLEKDFVHSNYMNTCFEKANIRDEDDFLEINLSGKFYCLQDKLINIHVASAYSQEQTNGTRLNDGSYEWVINSKNQDDVDIYYKVYRNKKSMSTAYGTISKQTIDTDKIALIEFFIIVAILIAGYIFYKRLYQRMQPTVKKRVKKKR